MLNYERIIQSWDTGIKAGIGHDPSVCATIAEREGLHYIIDIKVLKLEYPELKRAIIVHGEAYAPEVILLEDKASGQSLLQDFRRETDLPFVAINPTGDKVSRVLRITPLLESGKLKLPKYAPWLAAFEQEFFTFPGGAHDDQVDAISQYFNWLRAKSSHASAQIRRV